MDQRHFLRITYEEVEANLRNQRRWIGRNIYEILKGERKFRRRLPFKTQGKMKK